METKTTTSQNAFDNIIRRRTENSLAEQQRNFEGTHRNDTDAQLLAHLRRCAEEIGHSPNVCEVIGGSYIYRRFGNWDRALHLAGLGRPGQAPEFRRRWIYKQEHQRQLELHREHKCRKALEKKLKQEVKEP